RVSNRVRWKPYLRWNPFRPGVAGLMCLVLLLGGGLGLFVRSARLQREAVVAIRRAGGLVTYDDGETDVQSLEQKPRSVWWARVTTAVGVDYLSSVVEVHLPGSYSRVTDSVLGRVESLRHLRVLVLSSSPVCDAELRHLEALTNLEELYLCDTKITDAGLAKLAGLTRLKSVNLSGTKLRGGGLAFFTRCRGLERLDLAYSAVNDGGLAPLSRMTSLRQL